MARNEFEEGTFTTPYRVNGHFPSNKLMLVQPTRSPPTGVDLYARFALAGALGCSITHGSLTPVDVVKTLMQLYPETYNKGMVSTARTVVAEKGFGALWTGVGPTFVGYFIQGAFKFGGYEFWKKTLIDVVGVEKAPEYRTAIYMTSSALCEFVADIALCPLEATRIRLVSNPNFATGLASGFIKLWREEGILRGFYSGFGPILFKQIPYTIAKFVVYERTAEAIYEMLPVKKESLSDSSVVAVNLGSGLIAGFAAALISQPADTLLSKINKQEKKEGVSISSQLVKLARELGFKGLFLGLGARLVLVGVLTAGQFAIYGDIKRMLNATGAIEISKKKPATQ